MRTRLPPLSQRQQIIVPRPKTSRLAPNLLPAFSSKHLEEPPSPRLQPGAFSLDSEVVSTAREAMTWDFDLHYIEAYISSTRSLWVLCDEKNSPKPRKLYMQFKARLWTSPEALLQGWHISGNLHTRDPSLSLEKVGSLFRLSRWCLTILEQNSTISRISPISPPVKDLFQRLETWPVICSGILEISFDSSRKTWRTQDLRITLNDFQDEWLTSDVFPDFSKTCI